MPERVNVNGALGGPDEAAISPLDRGFLFGDSVYETIRTYGGRPFLLREHLDRLRRSAAALDIDAAAAPVDIEAEIARTLAAAGNPESAVRVVVSRGRGPLGYDPAGCGPPTVVIHVRACPSIPEQWRREGVDVAIVPVTRNAPAALDPAIKSSNLLNNFLAWREAFLAWREAHRLGAWEPILTNASGRIVEGASSNIFVVRDGRLRTPPLEDGLLPGITRAAVLELAGRDDLDAGEASLQPDDLRRADEAFLTSTLKGVLPIRRCDGWPIHDGRPGPVTRRVMGLFEALAQTGSNRGAAPGSSLR